MSNNNFLFSAIVAAYNTGEYLDECVESVVAQDIGFEENIQLILVNDGSTDNTGELCKKWAQKYPNNIVYLDKENGGISSARNYGLKYATGKYYNFIDSDDKWTKDAFSAAVAFFDKNPSIYIVAFEQKPFGEYTGNHPLWYKYKKDQIVDIDLIPDYIHLSVNNLIMDSRLMEGKEFDTRLKCAEDFQLLNSILLIEKKYGILSGPKYCYRKRSTSAIGTSTRNKSWYLDTPKYCHAELVSLSKKLYGEVIPYIQWCIMYDFQWRFKNRLLHPLNSSEYEEYWNLLTSLLQYIDDRIICFQRRLRREQKLEVLSCKYGCSVDDIRRNLYVEDGKLCWHAAGKDVPLWNVRQERKVQVDFLKAENGSFVIEGALLSVLPSTEVSLFATCGKKRIEAELFDRKDTVKSSFFNENYYYRTGFKVTVPVGSFELYVAFHDEKLPVKIDPGKFFSLRDRNSRVLINNKCLSRSENKFVLKPWDYQSQIRYEKDYWVKAQNLIESGLIEDSPLLFQHSDKPLDLLKFCPVGYEGKRIWVISDRVSLAGDNGEAFFTYLMKHPIPGVSPVFALSRKSSDFERLSKIGPVVDHGSQEYYKLVLKAEYIISSAADEYVLRPLEKMQRLFVDAPFPSFIFLQHGITKDDMSSWLRRWNKNIALLVTAAPRETESFISNPNYGYDENVIIQTGFPRHDSLLQEARQRQSKKKILICPTWRNGLANEADYVTGERPENSNFTQSEYYIFYQTLLNSPKLESAVKELGYEVDFLIHPAFKQEASKFSSSFAKICLEYNYRDSFIDSAIALTDYSSAVFDFAMLKKPLVYCQFDKDKVFSGDHIYSPGYFDYKNDGFGPITESLDSTVDMLIQYMKNPVMDEVYKRRVNDFFFWPEVPRCELLAEAIQKHSEKTFGLPETGTPKAMTGFKHKLIRKLALTRSGKK